MVEVLILGLNMIKGWKYNSGLKLLVRVENILWPKGTGVRKRGQKCAVQVGKRGISLYWCNG
jgi:hypothetical protein